MKARIKNWTGCLLGGAIMLQAGSCGTALDMMGTLLTNDFGSSSYNYDYSYDPYVYDTYTYDVYTYDTYDTYTTEDWYYYEVWYYEY